MAIQLYDEANRLMEEGRFAAACPKYAESMRIDPQLGALLHLADCYAQSGQLASAWSSLRDAEEMARSRDDDRAAFAREQVALLEPRLNRITIVASTPAPTRRVRRCVRQDGSVSAPAPSEASQPPSPRRPIRGDDLALRQTRGSGDQYKRSLLSIRLHIGTRRPSLA